jgi:hypothetical protein
MMEVVVNDPELAERAAASDLAGSSRECFAATSVRLRNSMMRRLESCTHWPLRFCEVSKMQSLFDRDLIVRQTADRRRSMTRSRRGR